MAFVLGLGFLLTTITLSSFTQSDEKDNNGRDPQIIRYYKTDPSTPASDPASYVYYSSNRCVTGGSLCSALWDITDSNPTPSNGDPLPAGASYQGSVVGGHFQ